jgi:hypothetical protein
VGCRWGKKRFRSKVQFGGDDKKRDKKEKKEKQRGVPSQSR